jgi:8-oxo-dGTP pyrophosphatase MutT (NUDIX family)
MRWTVHGERSIYESPWMSMRLVDVEIPGGPRFEHHVVRFGQHAAGLVVHDPARGVLLLWRHRFITDTWGWEIPAGRIEAGEDPADAAAREALEETGWRPGTVRHLTTYHPLNGTMDAVFHVFAADSAIHEGEPSHPEEAERVEWVPIERVRGLIRDGDVKDGPSLTALLLLLGE